MNTFGICPECGEFEQLHTSEGRIMCLWCWEREDARDQTETERSALEAMHP